MIAVSRIQIFDASGKLVYSDVITGIYNIISVTNFERGFYTLKLINDNEEFIEKMVVD